MSDSTTKTCNTRRGSNKRQLVINTKPRTIKKRTDNIANVQGERAGGRAREDGRGGRQHHQQNNTHANKSPCNWNSSNNQNNNTSSMRLPQPCRTKGPQLTLPREKLCSKPKGSHKDPGTYNVGNQTQTMNLPNAMIRPNCGHTVAIAHQRAARRGQSSPSIQKSADPWDMGTVCRSPRLAIRQSTHPELKRCHLSGEVLMQASGVRIP